jgi:hypothetical protein
MEHKENQNSNIIITLDKNINQDDTMNLVESIFDSIHQEDFVILSNNYNS